MEKKLKASAAKDEALKESFAEIKKAAATVNEAAKKPAAKAETSKATEKKDAVKKSEVKKAETKTETKAPAKTAEKKSAEKKSNEKKSAPAKAEVSTYITLQINDKDYEPAKLQADAIAAAKAIKADVQSVDVYVNVAESAAYYTIDGIGSSDYRIDL